MCSFSLIGNNLIFTSILKWDFLIILFYEFKLGRTTSSCLKFLDPILPSIIITNRQLFWQVWIHIQRWSKRPETRLRSWATPVWVSVKYFLILLEDNYDLAMNSSFVEKNLANKFQTNDYIKTTKPTYGIHKKKPIISIACLTN